MSRSVLDTARMLLKRRRFSAAITMLEGASDRYRDNFEYYLTTGIACLYVGDLGSANSYFQEARHIRTTDTHLLLAQAVMFMRRGDTDRAVQYYLDILDNEPGNKIALSALEFIRTKGTYETICRWADSGKLLQFYPPLGINPDIIIRIAVSACAGIAIGFLLVNVLRPRPSPASGPRADLSKFVLSVDEQRNAQEKDLTGAVYRYILSDKQIKKSYENAQVYFQNFRDNAAQVEINRILNSNASLSIRQKARMLMEYLSEPTFDSLTDNYSYEQVASDPNLYLGCWVSWSGRITNAVSQGQSYKCDLLVGYEDMKRVEGIAPLSFDEAPSPPIEGDRPVKVLAKIGIDDGKLSLDGRSVYQPVRKE
jgi:tetratricopeptide (TPR) repeat protein